MRKIILPSLVLGITMMFVACGPSAEEKAAAEQHMKDSIAASEKAIADSIMAVQQQMTTDSLAAVEAVRIATEDSLAALKTTKPKVGNKPKPAPEKPKEAPKSMKDAAGDKGDKKNDGEGKSIKDMMKNPK